MDEPRTTTDHELIKRWVEERRGHPARVKGTDVNGGSGVLLVDYPGYSGTQTLEAISWDEFFKGFEENELAFLYEDEKKAGSQSRFSKLINRDSAEKAKSRPLAIRKCIQFEGEIRMATSRRKRWSKHVTQKSNALDLEEGVFSKDDPRSIARSLKRSADRSRRRKSEPFRSAMSMLSFYMNRAGKKLSKSRLKRLEAAKEELRDLYGRPHKAV
ncbi:MAG TPA: DUF3175 domain-containing protein [Pyrinomonadaceae bacterium]|jgi:hypothetical protein|nr:DUF3175 domain-containing protein [Pyrinomonadaceae bacterium]